MKVEDLMSSEVLVVREDTPVDRMIQLFRKHEITGAPVIDESQKLRGVVSLSDLFRAEGAHDSHEFYLNPSWSMIPHHDDSKYSSTVKDIMTKLVIHVEADDDIERACDLMVDLGIHRLVVTRQGKVVGNISSGDLVREFRDRLKAAKQLR